MKPIDLDEEQNIFLLELILEAFYEGYENGTEDALISSSPSPTGISRDPTGVDRCYDFSLIRKRLVEKIIVENEE